MRAALDFLAGIERDYGVNPWIWAVIWLACWPPFGWAVAGLALALRRRRLRGTGRYILTLFLTWALPYAYILIFGRNLPIYVYLLMALGLTFSAVSLVRTLRGRVMRLPPSRPPDSGRG